MNFIRLENKKYIYTIIINRPKYYNALNFDLLKELNDCFDIINNDIDAKAIVITGAGDKAFIAGADIEEMSKMNKEEALKFSEYGHKLMTRIQNSSIPVISAINGYALGGGCELVISSHIRYASENAIIGQPEVGLGLIAGFGGTQRLQKIIGKSKAIELLITGESIEANKCLNIGLIDKIFKKDKLMLGVNNLCLKISNNSLAAIKATMKTVNYSLYNSFDASLKNESIEFSNLFESYDMNEGTKAFLEKRKPNFK